MRTSLITSSKESNLTVRVLEPRLDTLLLERKEMRRIGTALASCAALEPFTCFTADGFEGLFPINASAAQLIEKFEHLSIGIESNDDLAREKWCNQIERAIFILLSADIAEAWYLANKTGTQLSAELNEETIFYYLFYRGTSQEVRKKVYALCTLLAPFWYWNPDYNSFYYYYSMYVCQVNGEFRYSYPVIAATLREEKRITESRLTEIIDEI